MTNLGPRRHDRDRWFGWVGWSTPGIDPSDRSIVDTDVQQIKQVTLLLLLLRSWLQWTAPVEHNVPKRKKPINETLFYCGNFSRNGWNRPRNEWKKLQYPTPASWLCEMAKANRTSSERRFSSSFSASSRDMANANCNCSSSSPAVWGRAKSKSVGATAARALVAKPVGSDPKLSEGDPIN